jgi:hypothetical protein
MTHAPNPSQPTTSLTLIPPPLLPPSPPLDPRPPRLLPRHHDHILEPLQPQPTNVNRRLGTGPRPRRLRLLIHGRRQDGTRRRARR